MKKNRKIKKFWRSQIMQVALPNATQVPFFVLIHLYFCLSSSVNHYDWIFLIVLLQLTALSYAPITTGIHYISLLYNLTFKNTTIYKDSRLDRGCIWDQENKKIKNYMSRILKLWKGEIVVIWSKKKERGKKRANDKL